MKLTKLEQQVLQAILDSDNPESRITINNPVWNLKGPDVSMKNNQLPGAISSCVKKKYIDLDKCGSKSIIWITQKGYDLIKTK